MTNFKVIFVLNLILTAGCAAGTPYEKINPAPDKAAVYVYRPMHLAGGGLTPKVYCGGAMTQLSPGVYHRFEVAPGQIACTSSYIDPGNHEEVDLEVAPGHDYYVKETIGMGILVGRVHLALVDPEYGQGEAEKCKQQP